MGDVANRRAPRKPYGHVRPAESRVVASRGSTLTRLSRKLSHSAVTVEPIIRAPVVKLWRDRMVMSDDMGIQRV